MQDALYKLWVVCETKIVIIESIKQSFIVYIKHYIGTTYFGSSGTHFRF
jgi:hypothetical protein